MTNLLLNEPRRYRGTIQRDTIDVEAATTIFQGAAIEEGANGGAQNLTGAGTTFLGISEEHAANAGALGAKRVTFIRGGDLLLQVDNNAVAFARTAVGLPVYATDGNTFTTLITGAQIIGKIVEIPPEVIGAVAGKIWVHVEGVPGRSI